jgi:arylsulfatase A-like enzyme
MAVNVDFPATFLDYAGVTIPDEFQGYSLRPLLQGETPPGWQTSMYYRYWEHLSKPHRVGAHYGVRTERYKLIYYYGKALGASRAIDEDRVPEWELFDLECDGNEMNNVYGRPEYADVVKKLTEELYRLKMALHDEE